MNLPVAGSMTKCIPAANPGLEVFTIHLVPSNHGFKCVKHAFTISRATVIFPTSMQAIRRNYCYKIKTLWPTGGRAIIPLLPPESRFRDRVLYTGVRRLPSSLIDTEERWVTELFAARIPPARSSVLAPSNRGSPISPKYPIAQLFSIGRWLN